MTCPFQLQWEKRLENGTIDFKNNQKNYYSEIGPIVKDMFWCCGDNKIFYYQST